MIRQFAAWVDPDALAPVCAYVSVRFDAPGLRGRFWEEILKVGQVLECSRLAGDEDYLLKVRCGSLAELERLLGVTLAKLPGVARTRASVVLSTIKDTPVLPVPGVA